MLDRYTQANRELWNDWADIHVGSRFYDVEGFKAGACALRPLEVDELGDVTGKSLLHLQCHFGLDTLSWARRGARVTGIDLSDHAIDAARALAAELGIEATFICTPLYELEDMLDGEFDIVFTSYGAIEWLPDLDRWARIAARYVKPGGTFYMAEVHPLAQTLDETSPGSCDIAVVHSYFPGEPFRDEVQGSYADPNAHVEHNVCYSWQHDFAGVVGALTGAGLSIEYLHEFPFSVAPFWSCMAKADDGWWYLPGSDGSARCEDIPFVYSIKAAKPAGAAAATAAPQAAPAPAAAPAADSAAAHEPDSATKDYVDSNREMWDELVAIHEASGFYDVEGFLAGRDTFTAIERQELAPLVAGKDLLHLQCHFGLDTLTLARLGARVTGVDFSGEAVATARRLATAADLEARFVQTDVLALDTVVDERFDIVYTSWGVLIWLSDLARWAGQVRRALRPGGLFYIAEFHPAGYALDDRLASDVIRPGYSYFHSSQPLCFDEDGGDYADPTAKVAHTRSFEWTHTMGDIVSSLTGAGLEIAFLHEFPHCIGLTMPFLVTGSDGLKRVRGHEETFPLSFSLLATLTR
jgi:2-polyprenyl-3-methyl-5-hydroxy-6-metoxy-1,4-benzoquinol methylase